MTTAVRTSPGLQALGAAFAARMEVATAPAIRIARAAAAAVAPATRAAAAVADSADRAFSAAQPTLAAAATAYREAGGRESRKWGLHWHTLRGWVLIVSDCATEQRALRIRPAAAPWRELKLATLRRPPLSLLERPAPAEMLVRTLSAAPSAPGARVAA